MSTITADDGEPVEAISMPTVTRIVADGFEDADLYAVLTDGATLRLIAD